MPVKTVGSLFAGIGGFDIAFEKQGWKTVWHSEIDPYASKVFARHFPDSVNVGGITKFQPGPEHDVDILCGGFPCQDISSAGTTRVVSGLDGSKSGLWFQMQRIASDIRPRFIAIENTDALRYSKNGLGQILKDLAAIGYDAEWQVVSAASVGAPHLRKRVFIVAHPNGDSEPFEPQYEETPKLSEVARRTLWDQRPDSGEFLRMDDGLPSRVDRLKCLG